jgi:hypothetical protein
MPRTRIREQRSEAFQIRRIWIRHDVQVSRWADHAMRVDGEAADDDVPHASFVERPEQWLRVERIRHVLRACLNASANRLANSV